MCGRFFVEGESENELLARMIDEASRRQQAITGESSIATGEVFPASTVAAMTVGRSGNIGIFPMTWGFHLPPNNKLIINTRSETAMDKPMFLTSMLERRCLIPCSWYFEWEVRDAQQNMLDDLPSLQIQAAGQSVKGKTKSQQKIKYAIRPNHPASFIWQGYIGMKKTRSCRYSPSLRGNPPRKYPSFMTGCRSYSTTKIIAHGLINQMIQGIF